MGVFQYLLNCVEIVFLSSFGLPVDTHVQDVQSGRTHLFQQRAIDFQHVRGHRHDHALAPEEPNDIDEVLVHRRFTPDQNDSTDRTKEAAGVIGLDLGQIEIQSTDGFVVDHIHEIAVVATHVAACGQ